MDFGFEGLVVHWRGPAPFIFVAVPAETSAQIQAVSHLVSYGWGCIPVEAEIAGHGFTTALFPKNGSYLLPLKVAVRRTLPPIEIGDMIAVEMRIESRPAAL